LAWGVVCFGLGDAGRHAGGADGDHAFGYEPVDGAEDLVAEFGRDRQQILPLPGHFSVEICRPWTTWYAFSVRIWTIP
jgi:hypothetical protein